MKKGPLAKTKGGPLILGEVKEKEGKGDYITFREAEPEDWPVVCDGSFGAWYHLAQMAPLQETFIDGPIHPLPPRHLASFY